jgi:hypothetical protein
MAVGDYRPWGLLHWVINRCPNVRWSILATLSTEDRCLAAWRFINSSGILANSRFAEIKDPPTPRYQSRIEQKLLDRRNEFLQSGGLKPNIYEHTLFERYGDTINWINQFISTAEPNIIVDISCFPKRFFFPIIKILLKEPRVRNLIVTYTLPEGYPDEDIAENFQDWKPLPLFGGKLTPSTPPSELIIVNVGYLAMGLPEELEQGGPNRKIKLIFPFPDYPKSYHKNWYFIRTIEKNLPPERIEVKHVHTYDTSDAFDHLLSLTNEGQRTSLFAPYGPKPISLAMCIFASLTDSPVYYTQPRTYHPDYTKGVSYVDNNNPETYAYCLRLDGHNYYSV